MTRHRATPLIHPWEALGAIATGAAICLGAKFLYAAILIFFMATGGNP